MKKVLCFGELLLRYSPRLNGEWISNGDMPVFVGGAELNVARGLARWGQPVGYCTALPDHYLATEVIGWVGEQGIDVSAVRRSGARIGTYFLPQGADMKAAGVIYDRAYSSFWELAPGDIDWDAALEGIEWLHFSAISPALNAQAAAVCAEAAKAAADKGLTVSVDLNYRAKLWQYGKTPLEVMPELVQYCDVIMGNIWAEQQMLGIPVPADLRDEKEVYLEQSKATSEAIRASFPRCRQVANTFRFDAGSGVRYYATLLDGNGFYVSPEHTAKAIVDKVGSGDTFMAGLIYGNCQGWWPQEVIDFAAAAAFNKLFIPGDATTASVDAIKKAHNNYVY
ncbi:MAG: sugar kinase [Chitinophagaceae bacterium]|nr:MAG: sugar kinase [Chitinophagaceae bacterium]